MAKVKTFAVTVTCYVVQYRYRIKGTNNWSAWAVLNTPDNLTMEKAKRVCDMRRNASVKRNCSDIEEWRVLRLTQEEVY